MSTGRRRTCFARKGTRSGRYVLIARKQHPNGPSAGLAAAPAPPRGLQAWGMAEGRGKKGGGGTAFLPLPPAASRPLRLRAHPVRQCSPQQRARGFRPGSARSCAGRGKAAAGRAAALGRPILLRRERKGFAERSRLAARAGAREDARACQAPPRSRAGGTVGRCELLHANHRKEESVDAVVDENR